VLSLLGSVLTCVLQKIMCVGVRRQGFTKQVESSRCGARMARGLQKYLRLSGSRVVSNLNSRLPVQTADRPLKDCPTCLS
jgi:hypothetical protein